MKDLAKDWIRDLDSRMKTIPETDLDERLDLLYSLGYVYDPFEPFFYNPFIDKRLKPIMALMLDLKDIEKLHRIWLVEFTEKNGGLRKADEISSEIFKVNLNSRIRSSLIEMSGIIGIVLAMVAFVLSFTESYIFSLIATVMTFSFLGYYVSYNMMFEKKYGQSQLSQFWKKYQTFVLVLSVLTYPYLYYLLYLKTNYWLPVIILFALRFLIEKYMTKNLSKEYWETQGIISIDKYAIKNGIGGIL